MTRDYRPSRPKPPAGEPIDALLGAFFRSEVPSPWPAFRRPTPARLLLDQVPPRRPSYAGRLALAASVGLLFLGSWLLPATLSPRVPQGHSLPTVGPASAGRGGLVPAHLQPPKSGTTTPDTLTVDEDMRER
jgi:hypothetical protein